MEPALMDSTTPAQPPPSPSKQQVFITRLFSTVVLWALLALAFKAGQDWIFVALAAAFGFGSAFEYFRLMKPDAGARAFRYLGLGVAAGYWMIASWYALKHHSPHPMWIDLAAIAIALQGAFLLSYRRALEGQQTLQRIFSTVFGVVYTAVLFGFALRIVYFEAGSAPPGGVFLVLFLVTVTKFGDAGAYAFGVLFGKHKMIPHISPAKSWEGFVGAFVGCFITAMIVLHLIPEQLQPLTWTYGLIAAPILCCAGIAGDLAESVLKRCFAIKDSGHALPGIGGILDLTDSLLFTAPVFYFYLKVIS
jgi:phosphatidate cytidylyltransferase